MHGHTQSLHTNSLDEALALPSDWSARIARNTQLFIQHETDSCRIIDPWGGSYYVERLTHELAERAAGHIREIEEMGGMAQAIDAGLPKLRIEEAAARTQARIDAGRQAIVGVNQLRPDDEEEIAILKVDNSAVREPQIAPLGAAAPRARRKDDPGEAGRPDARPPERRRQPARAGGRRRPRQGHGRRDQRRARPQVFGRHQAQIQSVSGVYGAAMGDEEKEVEKPARLADAFAEAEGRRPRILVAKMGQDGHDRGQKVIASAFVDLGFDVDIGPLFQTPDEVARQAVDNDVHVVGRALARRRPPHPGAPAEGRPAPNSSAGPTSQIVVGGVIPPQDYAARSRPPAPPPIFGPGTGDRRRGRQGLLEKLNRQLGYEQAA